MQGNNATVDITDSTQSLFKTIDKDGTVENLTVKAADISYQNGVQGFAPVVGENRGTIQNVDVELSGILVGTPSHFPGGVAGQNYGTIENCHVTGGTFQSNGGGSIGGIAGVNQPGGTIIGCSAAEVTLQNTDGANAGGVVGTNKGTVIACYSTSAGSGQYIDGVVGWNHSGTVTACYSIGSSVVLSNQGGTVTACYWSGSDGSVKDSSGTKVSDWTEAINGTATLTGMNAALQGKGWHYVIVINGLPELVQGEASSNVTPIP